MLTKIGFDTAEKKPLKLCEKSETKQRQAQDNADQDGSESTAVTQTELSSGYLQHPASTNRTCGSGLERMGELTPATFGDCAQLCELDARCNFFTIVVSDVDSCVLCARSSLFDQAGKTLESSSFVSIPKFASQVSFCYAAKNLHEFQNFALL